MAEKKAQRAIWIALAGVVLMLFIVLVVFGEIFQCQRNAPIVEPQEEARSAEVTENLTVCLSLFEQTLT